MKYGFGRRLIEGLNLLAYLTVLAGVVVLFWGLLGLLVGVAIKAANFVLGV